MDLRFADELLSLMNKGTPATPSDPKNHQKTHRFNMCFLTKIMHLGNMNRRRISEPQGINAHHAAAWVTALVSVRVDTGCSCYFNPLQVSRLGALPALGGEPGKHGTCIHLSSAQLFHDFDRFCHRRPRSLNLDEYIDTAHNLWDNL